MATVTSPIILDQTGQDINTNLDRIAEALEAGKDIASNTVSFTSVDTANPSGFTTLPSVLTSGETQLSLWNKVSNFARNIRYIRTLLGNADLSAISDGTVTGAITEINASYYAVQGNAGFHNSLYRGKSLGTSITSAQWAAISTGTFEDLYVGDYWVINGVTWRIAHFDYWLNTGDINCTTHHVVIVPDTNLYNARMNTENVTTGGYHGSVMYATNLANTKTTINNAFGSSHILSHRELLTNAVSNGNASGWAWYDSTVELMSEVMVYGTLAWSVGGKGYEVGIDKEQLALFRLDHSRIVNRAPWWLRSVTSATQFAFVLAYGDANRYDASTSFGIRPAFGIF